jgi:hypothetical protein
MGDFACVICFSDYPRDETIKNFERSRVKISVVTRRNRPTFVRFTDMPAIMMIAIFHPSLHRKGLEVRKLKKQTEPRATSKHARSRSTFRDEKGRGSILPSECPLSIGVLL